MESDAFDGAASCSGSLWFPGWPEYIKKKTPRGSGPVYLSLGSREEKTKNLAMAVVGDYTRETYHILKQTPAVKRITLEWNKGGHFANPTERLIKGMLWLLQS